VETSDQQAVQLILLYKGDSKDGPMRQLLQRIATITHADLNAMWGELGIHEYDWAASPETRGANSGFPSLYEIQSYIKFERECHYDDVLALLQECKKATEVVHSDEAKRALHVLMSISERQHSLESGLSFRPSVVFWPPRTSIEPALPDVPRKSRYR
jgi:hypothetical protein